MEEFIKTNAEKFQMFKKNVFSLKQSTDFLTKLVERGDVDKMESELSKSLVVSGNVNTTSVKDAEERKNFIRNFVEGFKNISAERHFIKAKENENKVDKEKAWGMKNTQDAKIFKDDNVIVKKLKVKDKETEFPTLDNLELVNRQKEFKILDHHFANKLEKGIKICFCMSTRHPLVGNCVNCGRIQCLQEGDKECIVCGSDLLKKDQYLIQCSEDFDMKKAYTHKQKLLKFQADFYSKLQIIDDFTDWYELSNNTWINKDNREFAKKRDEELEKRRDDPEFEYNVNFKTLEITRVYDTIDEKKETEDINKMLQEKKDSNRGDNNVPKGLVSCKLMADRSLNEFNNLIKKNILKAEENVRRLTKRIDLDTNQKLSEELYNKTILENIELMSEFDNFPFMQETEHGMCLSMHQPWASLLIEGFKRFEGREWNSEYRGILWIHATSKKPERELVDQIENECRELYKDCKKMPSFPKRYHTSCLLGCVDVVDVIKKETYVKMIPRAFREKTESNFLFVCKNPRKLEIPIKMPGQQKLYELDKETLERTRDKLIKVNTFWWPCPGLDVDFTEIPFNVLMKHENLQLAGKQNKNSNKMKIVYNPFGQGYTDNSFILIQNLITKERKENIFNLAETLRKDFSYCNSHLSVPYIKYGLHYRYDSTDTPKLLEDIFEEISTIFKEEKKIKKSLSLKSVDIDYIDWYGCQNFTNIEGDTIRIVLGNSAILSILSDIADLDKGKSINLDNGDILYLNEGYYYAINQVLYEVSSGSDKNPKVKQGSIVLTYKCH
jgi:hypothetical protein